MTPLIQWAERYHISPAAMTDLLAVLGAAAPPDTVHAAAGGGEAAIQQSRRLVAARRGYRLWRNNVGACESTDGRVIRYGLANESEKINRVFKSSDLIGITPVMCTCGRGPWGVLTAEECKRPGWHLTPGDKRGQAQAAFGRFVVSMGGIFRFVTDPEQ